MTVDRGGVPPSSRGSSASLLGNRRSTLRNIRRSAGGSAADSAFAPGLRLVLAVLPENRGAIEPAGFGGSTSQGEWGILQAFLRNPSDPAAIAKKLESSALEAHKTSK